MCENSVSPVTKVHTVHFYFSKQLSLFTLYDNKKRITWNFYMYSYKFNTDYSTTILPLIDTDSLIRS